MLNTFTIYIENTRVTLVSTRGVGDSFITPGSAGMELDINAA